MQNALLCFAMVRTGPLCFGVPLPMAWGAEPNHVKRLTIVFVMPMYFVLRAAIGARAALNLARPNFLSQRLTRPNLVRAECLRASTRMTICTTASRVSVDCGATAGAASTFANPDAGQKYPFADSADRSDSCPTHDHLQFGLRAGVSYGLRTFLSVVRTIMIHSPTWFKVPSFRAVEKPPAPCFC